MALVLVALIFQVLVPRLSWLPIVVIFLYALVLSGGKFRGLRLGVTDGLVLGFLATGLIGAAIAFDPPVAWDRFWTLCGAVVLYFVLSRQPISSTAVVTGLGSLAAAALSILLLASAGQSTRGLDFPILSNWLRGGPLQVIGAPTLPPNEVGGIIALLLPICTLDFALSLLRKRGRGGWFSGVLLVIAASGLLVSSSRGAWVALVFGVLVGGCTWLLGKVLNVRSRVLLGAPIFAVVGLAVALWWVLYLTPTLPSRVDALLPGLPDAASRLDLARQAIWMAQDYPWTGVGLGAFGGVYSRYILLIPQFYFGYAHNLFIDVLVAQGPLGLICLVAVLLSAGWVAVSSMRLRAGGERGFLGPSVMAGLAILSLHGLVDSPAYAGSGVVLLFLYPGLAISWGGDPPSLANSTEDIGNQGGRLFLKGGLALGLAILMILTVQFRKTLLSTWVSNVNALQLADVELSGWPGQLVLLDKQYEQDSQLATGFARAISLDPRNRGAYYRLGLMAMRHDDFKSAVAYLAKAFTLTPDHRGIRKALGYAYGWDGEPEAAVRMLAGIPEARTELELYSAWWLEQGNTVMSQRTENVLHLMGN